MSGAASAATLIQTNTIGRGLNGRPLGNGNFGLLYGNGAPTPIQTGNVNVNNRLGPVRDTNQSPPNSSTTGTKAKSKKLAVKVHARAATFGDRPLKSLQTRGTLKAKSKA